MKLVDTIRKALRRRIPLWEAATMSYDELQHTPFGRHAKSHEPFHTSRIRYLIATLIAERVPLYGTPHGLKTIYRIREDDLLNMVPVDNCNHLSGLGSRRSWLNVFVLRGDLQKHIRYMRKFGIRYAKYRSAFPRLGEAEKFTDA